jgi:hypothetical protein
MLNLTFIPENYRETAYLWDRDHIIHVAGLARPDYYQDPAEVMNYLKQHNIHTLFGLDGSELLRFEAEKHGLIYRDVSIPDFTAPEISLYEQIYATALSEHAQGYKIAIHCRGGIGRTGTVLAALKLKEFAAQGSLFASSTSNEGFINLPYSQQPIRCSVRVREAIRQIRTIPGSENAVEAEVQVKSLMLYEQYLCSQHRPKPKEDLQAWPCLSQSYFSYRYHKEMTVAADKNLKL